MSFRYKLINIDIKMYLQIISKRNYVNTSL